MIDFQEHMNKTIQKLSTLKRSTCFNTQQLREYQDEALNDAKENGTTKTIEELEKLSQTIQYKM